MVHKIIFGVCFLFCVGCAGTSDSSACKQKISPRVNNWLEMMDGQHDSVSTIELVLTLNDTSRMKVLVPNIFIANSAAATISATGNDIRTLCRLQQVLYIEISKQLFPK